MNEAVSENQIDLTIYVRILNHYKWVLFVIGVVAALVSSGVNLYVFERYYRASTTALVNIEDSPTFPSTFGGLFSGIGGGNSKKDLLVEILKSRRMTSYLVTEFDLEKNYGIGADTLRSRTKVEILPSGLLRLSVEDKSPTFSALVSNAYVDALDTLNEELGFSPSKPILQVLDKALIPQYPFRPRKKRNVMVSVAAAFILGSLGVIFMDLFLLHKVSLQTDSHKNFRG